MCPCMAVSLCGPVPSQPLSLCPRSLSLPQLVNIACQNIFFFLSFFFFSSSRIPSKNSPRGLFSLFTKIEIFFPFHPPFFFSFCLFPAPLPAPHTPLRGSGPGMLTALSCLALLGIFKPVLSPTRAHLGIGEAWRVPPALPQQPSHGGWLRVGWGHICFLFSRKKKQKPSP